MIREYIESIPGGRHWSMTVRKGVALELTDLSGGSNVGMLIYNAENTTERLNLPDSLKCQHTFKITLGNCLYTDMGRILCSVIDDDAGWHDATSGTCTEALLATKPWSKDNYQKALNDYVRNGQDSFLIELGKYEQSTRPSCQYELVFSSRCGCPAIYPSPQDTNQVLRSGCALKWTALSFVTLVLIPSMTHPIILRQRFKWPSASHHP